VVSQSYKNWELLIADGGSKDASLEIIANFKDHRIKVLPGVDSSSVEGFLKGINNSTGEAIMFTTSTDGYVDTDWFKTAITTLIESPTLSLVWGGWTQLRENKLSFSVGPQPERFIETNFDMFKNWFASKNIERSYIPELNYCVRSNVYKQCLIDSPDYPLLNSQFDPILKFHFNFMRLGYMSKFIPTIASFGREHERQLQSLPIQGKFLNEYAISLEKYRHLVMSKNVKHSFRDSNGNVLNEVNVL
jgi:glycosyltransferase involved in cell wall biosynthesis